MVFRDAYAMILAILLAEPSLAAGQLPRPAAPTAAEAVGPFDAVLVERAATLLSSPQHWNRVDTESCRRTDTTYSIRCPYPASKYAPARWFVKSATTNPLRRSSATIRSSILSLC
jgi:hypothetical protein